MKKYISSVSWQKDANWLAVRGDECWTCICDHFLLNQWFTIDEAAKAWRGDTPQSRREVRLVLRNVLAEYAATPNDCPVERVGHRWRFIPHGEDA